MFSNHTKKFNLQDFFFLKYLILDCSDQHLQFHFHAHPFHLNYVYKMYLLTIVLKLEEK